jgi:hypothetical protein
MTTFIVLSMVLLLVAWLMRREAQRQIGDSLSGRILYTDTEANRETLTSDHFNLSGKPDYILEEHGELIPWSGNHGPSIGAVPMTANASNWRRTASWSKNVTGNPCDSVGWSIKTAR